MPLHLDLVVKKLATFRAANFQVQKHHDGMAQVTFTLRLLLSWTTIWFQIQSTTRCSLSVVCLYISLFHPLQAFILSIGLWCNCHKPTYSIQKHSMLALTIQMNTSISTTQDYTDISKEFQFWWWIRLAACQWQRGFPGREIGPLIPPPWPPLTMDMTFHLWMRLGQASHHLRPHWYSRWNSILKRLWYNTSKEKLKVPTCQKEAVIQLEAIHAQSKVKQVECLLALYMAKECEILGQLYCLQAEHVVK